MKRLNGAGTRALDTIRAFTVAQRTIALIGVAVLVLGGVALANWLGAPTYQVLYSNISAANASAVVAQVNKDGVKYQLTDGGTTILVPAASVDSERLATASLLSSGAGGYSLLDDLGVTASEFQQNVTYKRAIEGELAKTIESIDGVASASVQLAIPQQSVFSDDKQNPTASVFVNVSTPLTTDQVNAVVHLVAAAYPGLTTENVSVVDQKGDTLSSVGSGTSGNASDAANSYEASTKAAVQAMLDKVLGPGNAVVTVAADVSNSSGTTSTEKYTTGNSTPLNESSNTVKSTGSGAGTTASGVAGVDTTGGNGATTTSGGTGSTFSQTQASKDNAIDKTTSTQTIVPGTLTRQTIAVAVNQNVTGVSVGSLDQMVKNASGYNGGRGDSVSITQVPFSTAAAKSASAALKQSQAAQSSDQMMGLIKTAIQVVGGIVLFVLVIGLLRRLFRRQDGGVRDAGPLNIVPVPVGGDPMLGGMAPTAQLGSMGAPTVAYGLPAAGPAASGVRAPADASFAQLQADVDALAGTDPEQTAEYLRALMGDRAGV